MSGNVLERENVGGEIVTKKLDNIIKSGKEKIKKWKKIEIGIMALINTIIGFNTNAEPLNLPKEYSENIVVKGQEKDVFDYDFNSDGINEKVVVTYSAVNNLIGAVISIYTNQGGKDILTYQIAFDKKFNIMELQAMQKMLDKVKIFSQMKLDILQFMEIIKQMILFLIR